MIRIALILLALAAPLAAEPRPDPALMPLHEVVKTLSQRFAGRILAARLDMPTPFEFALGTDAVHEITLLSPQRHILKIRMDAATGQLLEARGRGLNAARRTARPAP